MNELCLIIKNTVIPNFINMETAIKTVANSIICPCIFRQNLLYYCNAIT